MSIYLKYVFIAVFSYLIGSLNFGIIVSHKEMHDDIRKYGSGNAGLTNIYRVMGWRGALPVFLGDAAKGVITALVGMWMLGRWGCLTAGFFTLLGHSFPLYFNFKGGKGILSTAAMLFVFDWRIGLIAVAAFIAVVACTRFVSLGSIIGSLSFPVSVLVFYRRLDFAAAALLIAALLVFFHRSNIGRLLNGTESKLSFGKKHTEAN